MGSNMLMVVLLRLRLEVHGDVEAQWVGNTVSGFIYRRVVGDTPVVLLVVMSFLERGGGKG